MLCQICQQNEATMKITKIVGGVATEYNICESCAPQVSDHYAKIMKKKEVDKKTVENLLKDLLQQGSAATKPDPDVEADLPTCPECGLNYLKYRQSFMLGCPNCYEAFGENLRSDIRKIHGASQHIGEAPMPVAAAPDEAPDNQLRLHQLERELQECVEKENFDQAAELRDQINELKKTIESERED